MSNVHPKYMLKYLLLRWPFSSLGYKWCLEQDFMLIYICLGKYNHYLKSVSSYFTRLLSEKKIIQNIIS